ncbi:MAG: formate dehydrogenase subunit delta [Alphaproteobacteria bacterium]|nr:formate dehydrogenase subunit delta [Alphaproteobacteria bacterium]
MNPDHMVHMANQIARFFAAYPHEQAVEGIADHLKKFWEARMRTDIEAHVAKGGAGLDALVVEAVKKLQKH